MAADPETIAAGKGVWPLEGGFGYRRAIASAGTVAAPLLAGFSFTLLVLLLPMLSTSRTTVVASGGVRLVSESQSFSAAPELAAGMVLLAGLLFIFSVQAGVFVLQNSREPVDLLQWYPEYFPVGKLKTDELAELREWDEDKWQALNVGDQWFAGWPRKHLYEQARAANRWADRMRRLYQGGIVLLLTGLTVLVWPPAEDAGAGRWALVCIGAFGVLAEVSWILRLPGWCARLLRRVRGRPATD